MDRKSEDRNRPADKGRDHDPNLRDESAIQPGMNTSSCSDTDEANEEITRTTADHEKRATEEDDNADPTYDEINKE